jgi:catechol 2,3-dioxygenase-like lactoylglutathione lyase family enzyme
MPPFSVYESCLYARDLAAADRFYGETLGLRRVGGLTDRGRAYRLSPASMLLVFNPDQTRVPSDSVPSHGCEGQGHVALSIAPGEYDRWKTHLAAAGFPTEREVAWPAGGRSFYVRDPAGNSVELIEGQAWAP